MSTGEDTTQSWPAYVRQVLEYALRGEDLARAVPPANEPVEHGGVFVTLRKQGLLRGCMGTLDPNEPIAKATCSAAQSAALKDPRFPPISLAELPNLTIEVSILSQPWPMGDIDELERGRHGILVRQGFHRGLFLPQVATEHNFDKETFLSRCCSEKAGLAPDAWRDPATEVLLFTADIFRENQS
ncbi:MAG: AmmeMemoRadiSam system protein A [Planctomycetes bacterium]|nr:AmmeMemoRadiSam system protein A [Planctomycetota bacterium]